MKDIMTRVKEHVRKALHNSRGFTLIELLVVLAIIGIIAAIAVPRYTASLEKAKESTCAANIAVLESAAMRYYVDNDFTYPAETQIDDLAPNYVKEVPKCPLGGTYSLDIDTDNPDAVEVTCNHTSSTPSP